MQYALVLFGFALAMADTERTFELKTVASTQDIQEIATVVRSVGEIRDLHTIEGAAAFAVKGTDDQVKLAAWLTPQLDAATRAPEHRLSGTIAVAGDTNDVVLVLQAGYTKDAKDFQALATLIRSVCQIRRVFVTTTTRFLVLRSSPAELEMAQWIFDSLDQPAAELRKANGTTYRVKDAAAANDPNAPNDTVRILQPARETTVADFQEMATAIRSVGELRLLFADSPTRSLVVRGPLAMVEMASWLFGELDQATPRTASAARPLLAGEMVGVSYLPAAPTVAEFQRTVTDVRRDTGIRRVFTYNRTKAMIVRAEPALVAEAMEKAAKAFPATAK